MSGWPNVSLKRHALLLGACLLVSFLPGVFGAAFPPGEWYVHLDKSALTPPGWVFPIAWTLLYIAIGVALYLFLVQAPPPKRRGALVVFGVQLVLNALWSWIFFGLHEIGAALVEIVALWLAIVATMIVFGRHSRVSAKLLLPYLLWVSFATYLTFAIWIMNS
jgi:tryptophan-rich sensory protein